MVWVVKITTNTSIKVCCLHHTLSGCDLFRTVWEREIFRVSVYPPRRWNWYGVRKELNNLNGVSWCTCLFWFNKRKMTEGNDKMFLLKLFVYLVPFFVPSHAGKGLYFSTLPSIPRWLFWIFSFVIYRGLQWAIGWVICQIKKTFGIKVKYVLGTFCNKFSNIIARFWNKIYEQTLYVISFSQ